MNVSKIIISALLGIFLSASLMAAPPTTIRGSNNQIMYRVYRQGNTTYYHGAYNQRLGYSRNQFYYNNNGTIIGRNYNGK